MHMIQQIINTNTMPTPNMGNNSMNKLPQVDHPARRRILLLHLIETFRLPMPMRAGMEAAFIQKQRSSTNIMKWPNSMQLPTIVHMLGTMSQPSTTTWPMMAPTLLRTTSQIINTQPTTRARTLETTSQTNTQPIMRVYIPLLMTNTHQSPLIVPIQSHPKK